MSVSTFEKLTSGPRPLIVGVLGRVTSALALVIILTVILSAKDSANPGAEGYAPLAYSAFAVVLAAVIVGAFVRRVRIYVSAGFAVLLWLGDGHLCSSVYRGFCLPQVSECWNIHRRNLLPRIFHSWTTLTKSNNGLGIK